MLNKEALTQLSRLKSNLQSNKDLAQGTVRATSKRFGFVRLDDGRDAFIDPDSMQRVLPGDRVEVDINTNAKGQLEANLEKLLDSPLQTFVGSYTRKGQAHFVVPDLPPSTRWLFIPPQERTNCAEGDYVTCKILRHPFHHQGKAQVRILQRIGRPEEPGIEGRYIAAKHRLPMEWPTAVQEQAEAILKAPQAPAGEHRADLSELPFVTIDSENTRDMDDALHIAKTDAGWELSVAIADPTTHIAPGSPLEQEAKKRASTVYLLGQPLTMLPTELSHDTFSLVPEENRPALVCRMQINHSGEVTEYHFQEAIIRSRYKLSYQGVSAALEDGAAPDAEMIPAEIPDDKDTLAMLRLLRDCARARIDYRTEHALVMEERADYYFVLNEQKKIDRIEKRRRTIAHRLVEEAMLATNICAGEFLAQHPGQGIFSTHVGFRPERMDEAVSLLRDDKPDYRPEGDLTQLRNFQQLMRELRLNPNEKPLLAALQRMLQAGALSAEHRPHFGLGFAAYATITSPIRRYHDLHNHLAIKKILSGDTLPPVGEADIEQLQQQLSIGRQACRQLEQWLACQYMAKRIGGIHQGNIALVSPKGIGVRLDDCGIEGFVFLADKKSEKKPGFDARRLKLTVEEQVYQLEQPVTVIVTAVDLEKRRIALDLVDQATAERLRVWSEPSS